MSYAKVAESAEPPPQSNWLPVNGPEEGVKYPLKVVYCGECSLPLEYCYLQKEFNKCKEWLEKNLPDVFEQMYLEDEGEENEEGEAKKGRQKRGGKALQKPKKKASKDRGVGLARASRGKKKYVTVVTGLNTFDIDLKDAAKFFASKFACGSSVTGADEIVIQGDVKDDLFDLIPEKWPQIDEDLVDDLGDRKL
jgi:density-regulated protein DRP1